MGVMNRRNRWTYSLALAVVFGILISRSTTANARQFITKTIISQRPSEIDWWRSSGQSLASLRPIAYAALVGQPVDCGKQPCLALTFDDGPDSIITPQIVDTLNRYGAHATFFVVGAKVQPSTNLLLQMHVSGHEIENHSWAHPDFRRLKPVQIREQIDLTQQAVGNAGVPRPRFFRPPYEFRSDSIRHTVDMPFMLWNVDAKDWAQKNPDKLAQDIIASAKPGAIIVLHDTKEVTLQALPKVLDSLRAQYRFVTVRDLLQLPDNARGEFASR